MYLNLNLALTVGYLNPALKNSAQVYFKVSLPSIMTPCSSGIARGQLQGWWNPPSFFCAMALAIIARGMRVLLLKKMKRKSIEKALHSFSRVTYEPCLTATSVIRSPRYYGHLFLAQQNSHTFSY